MLLRVSRRQVSRVSARAATDRSTSCKCNSSWCGLLLSTSTCIGILPCDLDLQLDCMLYDQYSPLDLVCCVLGSRQDSEVCEWGSGRALLASQLYGGPEGPFQTRHFYALTFPNSHFQTRHFYALPNLHFQIGAVTAHACMILLFIVYDYVVYFYNMDIYPCHQLWTRFAQ